VCRNPAPNASSRNSIASSNRGSTIMNARHGPEGNSRELRTLEPLNVQMLLPLSGGGSGRIRRYAACHACPHELANNLSRRSVLEPANLKKLVAQLAFHSDSKSHVLAWHATSVTIGYTNGQTDNAGGPLSTG